MNCPSASSPSKLYHFGCNTITANPLNWSRSHSTVPTSLTCQTWIEQLEQDGAQHKLKYIFLANDVILQVRKKGTSLLDAFRGSLPRAFEHMRDRCAANDIAQVLRQPRVCLCDAADEADRVNLGRAGSLSAILYITAGITAFYCCRGRLVTVVALDCLTWQMCPLCPSPPTTKQ